MVADVFLRDHLDGLVDQEDANQNLNEVLITWLIDNGIFAGPVNSVEDVNLDNAEILGARAELDGGVLVIHGSYTLDMTCFYVDKDEQDQSFTAKFELAEQFRLVETAALMDDGELQVRYRLEETRPSGQINLVHCEYGLT